MKFCNGTIQTIFIVILCVLCVWRSANVYLGEWLGAWLGMWLGVWRFGGVCGGVRGGLGSGWLEWLAGVV